MKIHVLHTGYVCVSPYLPFGGEHCSLLQAAGVTVKKKDRLWLPVSAYYIEHPKGNILVDCGWDRLMSPKGVFDRKAQIKSLGSFLLYLTNQGKIEKGAAIDEQLTKLNIKTSDLDYVLLSHLDCDHANGLRLVKDAKHILVSREELAFASQKSLMNHIRYQKIWWQDIDLETFDWNGHEGPFHHSYDLFGDQSVMMIHIPGHSDGQCAIKLTNKKGEYVLLFADGGYATRSWQEMILPGISNNKKDQMISLQWIKDQSLDPKCLASFANHDPNVLPQIIEL